MRSAPTHCLLALAFTGLAGCRLHPASLAVSLVGQAVDDRDVRQRKQQLLGKEADAADEMFGRRHDTLVDDTSGRRWLIYREPGEPFSESFYIVETAPDGRITGVRKCKRNRDGLEDIRETRRLEGVVYGKTPDECEQEAGLGEPVAVMRSELSGAVARFYDVGGWSHEPGIRFCVLIFSERRLCEEVRLIGITAQ